MRKFNAIIESTTPPVDTNVLWINGQVAKHYTNGKWVELMQEDTNEADDIELLVGNTDEIKAHNLAMLGSNELSTHVKINDPSRYGPEYGTVFWIPNSGGLASASNAAGSHLYYNIASNGAISNYAESFDLYLQYVHSKIEADEEYLDAEDFNSKLIELINYSDSIIDIAK